MGIAVLMAMATMRALGIIKPPPPKVPIKSPSLPSLASEDVTTFAQKQARKRRGLGSTILTGDLTVDPSQIGKKTLLGS